MAEICSVYQPHIPRYSAYYQGIEDNFESLEKVYEDRFERQNGFFCPYVTQIIYRYLDCCDLHNGFARVKCRDCSHECLLAFSCKRRHFCPSCHEKQMVEFGAGICQEIINILTHLLFVCTCAIVISHIRRGLPPSLTVVRQESLVKEEVVSIATETL